MSESNQPPSGEGRSWSKGISVTRTIGRSVNATSTRSGPDLELKAEDFAEHFAEAEKAANGDYFLQYARVKPDEVSVTPEGIVWRGQKFQIRETQSAPPDRHCSGSSSGNSSDL